jgi:hypothetical protein
MTRLAKTLACATLVAVLLAPRLGHAAAADPDALARELAALRSEVEALSDRIERAKDDRRTRLRALETQRADVEMELQREKLRLKQLEDTVGKVKARIGEASRAQSALKPAVLAAIDAVRGRVAAGLPYRVGERTGALTTLRGKVAADEMPPAQALARLWEHIEDELRLGRESALDRQVIALDDGERLVDVIKVGMVALYYRAGPGEYGRAVPTGAGTWTFERYAALADRERLDALFDSFDKRIRVGFFEVPNALAPQGGKL